MTESEWLTSSNAESMIEFVENATTTFRTRWQGPVEVKRFPVSPRKRRLLGLAIASGVKHLVPEEPYHSFLALVEDWADDKADVAEVGDGLPAVLTCFQYQLAEEVRGEKWTARWAAEESIFGLHPEIEQVRWVAGSAVTAVTCLVVDSGGVIGEIENERSRQSDLVRCVLGNPFRTAKPDLGSLPANSPVQRIARSVYDERAFSELPVLADALEDAGCDEADLIAHLRSGGPHARGCWALDLVLGNE